MARFSRNFIQSEVSTHATCNDPICFKVGLNVSGRFQFVFKATEFNRAWSVKDDTDVTKGGNWKNRTRNNTTYQVLVNGITILASVVHMIRIICKMASIMVRNFDKSALACALWSKYSSSPIICWLCCWSASIFKTCVTKQLTINPFTARVFDGIL